MPRFNVTMPQELWDELGREAVRSAGGNRSFVLRRALEAALDLEDNPVTRQMAEVTEEVLAQHLPSTPASENPPVQAGPNVMVGQLPTRRCERCKVPIKSPSLRRHDGCGGGKVVPEPE